MYVRDISFFYTSKNKSSLKDLGVAVSGITMPFDNGTWVEFTAMREISDGVVRHLDKATGVVVAYVVEDDIAYYVVQH